MWTAYDFFKSNDWFFKSFDITGEANVYTLGDIGGHRIVSTKLPMTGSSGNALIATGSSTTRLLGTFQVNYFSLISIE